MADDVRVPITSDLDIVQARQKGRQLAADAGFTSGDQTVIAAAISEIARNILMYARAGEMTLSVVANGERHALEVVARDEGPGIRDVERAMQDGYSTSVGPPATPAPARRRSSSRPASRRGRP